MALDVNYPAWSLSVEAFFYFIFPLLYFNLKRLTNRKLLIVSALAWILNIYVFVALKNEGVPENFIKFFPVLHVATFLTGMSFGILFIRNYVWLEEVGKKYIHTAAIITTIFIIYSAYKNYNFYNYQHNGLLSPYYLLVIYSLSLTKGTIAKILSSKPLLFLGSISYSAYILQYPIYQICQKYLPWLKNQTKEDMFYGYVVVLILASSLTYLFIEEPARKYLTRRF
jgi:peptidoglycan/LPS O-acetylase OafA/YrhL